MFVRLMLLATASVALAACAQPKVLIANSSSITIQRTDTSSVADAAQMATQHCNSLGKDARLATQDGFISSFDCVDR